MWRKQSEEGEAVKGRKAQELEGWCLRATRLLCP